MGFITYQRQIPHLYCQRVVLNVSSASEGLLMDLLPGSKTLRSLQRKKWGKEISVHSHIVA